MSAILQKQYGRGPSLMQWLVKYVCSICFIHSHFVFSTASTEHRESPPIKRRKVVVESNQSGSDTDEHSEPATKPDTKSKSVHSTKTKQSVKKTTTKTKIQLVNNDDFNGDADSEEGNSLMGFTERRATPKTNYDETSAHCPLPGCDSKGLCLCLFHDILCFTK